MTDGKRQTGTRRVKTQMSPKGQMSTLEKSIRRAVRKRYGLTFRCDAPSCGGRLILFVNEKVKEKEGTICEDCGGDLREIDPTRYYAENHLIEVPEGMAEVLNAIREERGLEQLQYD